MSTDKLLGSYDDGIDKMLALLRKCKRDKNALFICGNGGSAGISQHLTGDFLKNGGFRTFSMYGQPTITCISNDLSYDYVFCKQLELLANNDDLLIAISSSGNLENIVKDVKAMKKLGEKLLRFLALSQLTRKKIQEILMFMFWQSIMAESIYNLVLQQLVDTIVESYGVAMRRN